MVESLLKIPIRDSLMRIPYRGFHIENFLLRMSRGDGQQGGVGGPFLFC